MAVKIPTCMGWVWGAVNGGECIVSYETRTKLERLVLLNAMIPAGGWALIATRPATIDEAKELARAAERIESYIGHEATAEVLSRMLGVHVPVNRGMYVPSAGDVALVVRLRKRLAAPQDVKDVTEEDLEFLIVNYVRIEEP
jgi:hypothetical protein